MIKESLREVIITLKFQDKKMIEKFQIYDEFKLSSSDIVLNKCIDLAKKSFIYKPEEIKIKVNFQIEA